MLESVHEENVNKATPGDNDTLAKQGALLGSFSPMLRVLKMIGSYYENRRCTSVRSDTDAGRRPTDRWTGEIDGQQTYCETATYPTIVLVVLWVNVVRHMFVFKANEEFAAPLINKLTYVVVLVQCAVMQTAYYVASRDGSLVRVLAQLRVTEELAKRYRACCFLAVTFNTRLNNQCCIHSSVHTRSNVQYRRTVQC